MKKVNWLSIFIYVSIAFLIYYLYRNDLLKMPVIKNWSLLTISILVLFIGYFTNAYTWYLSLKRADVKVAYTDALTSIGLAVFGKYMPGKVWVVVGRAAFISERSGKGIKKLSVLSLNVQFIMLWTGLIIGTIGLIMVGGWSTYGYLCLAGIAALTLLIFSDYFHRLITFAAEKFLKREVNIPKLSFISIVNTLPAFFAHWILWTIAFYFFAGSISDSSIDIAVGMAFPLAATIGIIAVIAPGGLGVREGIIVAYLTMAGLSIPEATSISVASRLWFLLGEVFVFLLAFVLKQTKKPRELQGS